MIENCQPYGVNKTKAKQKYREKNKKFKKENIDKKK